MKWGYSGYGNKVINARSETAFEKPMFRKSMQERRCLLPASGYYEWRHAQRGQEQAEIRSVQGRTTDDFHGGALARGAGRAASRFRDFDQSGGAGYRGHPRPYAGDFAGGGLSPHADPGRLMGMAMEDMVIRPVS